MSKRRFKEISSVNNAVQAEERIMAFWEEERIFYRSVSERGGKKDFVFYEGPPTANGRPGVHHVMARLGKDVICRYRTMRGNRVIRKAGWDTHGLPVEIEVENALGIKNKDHIEAIGIEEFNAKCRESVFKYEKEWELFTKRIGYWLDLENPYITCTNEYIESVWWILKEFWKKGLLYEGHKIVPYCPRCGTSLSSHEVSQGYEEVSDPSIFIKFKLANAEEFFLVWTTTPWTLISNAALAVGEDRQYVKIEHHGDRLILAEARLGVLDGEYKIIEKFDGKELVGKRYIPLFPYFKDQEKAFIVLAGDFVSLEEGTGIVHIAPAFGEDDYRMHLTQGVPVLQPVTPSGTFSDEITQWVGMDIKTADPLIIDDLRNRGLLYKSGKIKHSYPFCWRCSKPLIYYARRSWYIKTTAFKDQLIEANRKINWLPCEVGEFRFGDWLENNIDWALSRERYWGTPLNIWTCSECGKEHAVGSLEELKNFSEDFPEDAASLDLHKPAVDELKLRCPECKGPMARVKEVIDCWFDSGSMPFAQYHYPFDEEKMFSSQFPADFICEGVDQSRGWFYSLLVIAVFLKGESPYRNVLTTGMILDKHGLKMSKSKGNAVEPWDVLNKEGADALRWYLLTTSAPWMPTRFDRKGVIEAAQKLLGTLRNIYSFFAMYAEIDDYILGEEGGEPDLLDRWVLSRYNSVAKEVVRYADAYEVTRATRLLQSFVLDELSNWYVRRSRRRFWKGEKGPDKTAAYCTLYTVLTGVIKLLAPFVPFLCEEIHQALRKAGAESLLKESIHLEDYPAFNSKLIQMELEELMETAITISSLGRTVRNEAGIKIRQPLREIFVHDISGRTKKIQSNEELVDILLDELHIKKLSHIEGLEGYITLKALPNYPALGRRFGKRVPEIIAMIEKLGQSELMSFKKRGSIELGDPSDAIRLCEDDLSVSIEGKAGFGAREEKGITVIIDLTITNDLRIEGQAREIINRLQNLRKKAGLNVTDRIRITYIGGKIAEKVFEEKSKLICNETLALSAEEGKSRGQEEVSLNLEGEEIILSISKEN